MKNIQIKMKYLIFFFAFNINFIIAQEYSKQILSPKFQIYKKLKTKFFQNPFYNKSNEEGINQLLYTNDNKYLLIVSENKVRVLEWMTQKFVKEFASDEINCVSLSADNQYLIIGTRNGLIKIWDFYLEKQIKQLHNHFNQIYNAELSKDNHYLWSAAYDQYVCKYDMFADSIISKFKLKDWMRGMIFTKESNLAVNIPYNSRMKLWDLNKSEMVKSFKTPIDGIKLYKTKLGKIPYSIKVFLRRIFPKEEIFLEGIAFSPDEKKIATSGHDGSVRVFKIEKKRPYKKMTGHWMSADKVGFSPDKHYLVSTSIGYYTQNLIIWDIKSKKKIAQLLDFPSIKCFAFSQNGKYLAIGGNDNFRGEKNLILIYDISSLNSR